MATKTAGSKTTTNLTAIQWQPGGLSPTDLATINELIKSNSSNNPPVDSCRIENGFLFFPSHVTAAGYRLSPGDWIMVDALGWPYVVPASNMANAGSSWTHS